MKQPGIETSAENVTETLGALEQLIGDLSQCVNAPECTDGTGLG
jgi:hypothetical protein